MNPTGYDPSYYNSMVPNTSMYPNYYGMNSYVPPVQGFNQMASAQPGHGAAPAHKSGGGFFGGLLKMATRPQAWIGFAKGATIGLAKSIIETVWPPSWKTLVAAAGIALCFVPGVGQVVMAAGLAMAAFGLLKSTATAATLYGSGQDELGDKAMEGVGTSAAGLGLAMYGARTGVRSGAINSEATVTVGSRTIGGIDDAANVGIFQATKQALVAGADEAMTTGNNLRNGTTTVGTMFADGRANMRSFYEGAIKADKRDVLKLDADGNPLTKTENGVTTPTGEKVKIDFRSSSDEALIRQYAAETDATVRAAIEKELTGFQRGYDFDGTNFSTNRDLPASMADVHAKEAAARKALADRDGVTKDSIDTITTETRYAQSTRQGAIERDAQRLARQEDLNNNTVQLEDVKKDIATAKDAAKQQMEAAKKIDNAADKQAAIDTAKAQQKAVQLAEGKVKAYEAQQQANKVAADANAANAAKPQPLTDPEKTELARLKGEDFASMSDPDKATLADLQARESITAYKTVEAKQVKIPTAFDQGNRFLSPYSTIGRIGTNYSNAVMPGLGTVALADHVAWNNPFANLQMGGGHAVDPNVQNYTQSYFTTAA